MCIRDRVPLVVVAEVGSVVVIPDVDPVDVSVSPSDDAPSESPSPDGRSTAGPQPDKMLANTAVR
ncbi:MAG: hypothetical protein KUG77_18010 [Nannocystaceae bacterium]|nr:hypothetical protein [Nannocystaceae bacterium]